MGLILFMLSQVLALVLLPLGIVYGLIVSFWKHRAKTGIINADRKLLELAKAVDKYGNVVCAEVFNHTLIKRESVHPFGRIEQTISAVIGHNLLDGTLTRTGRVLNWVLDRLDPDHSLKAALANK